MIHGEWAEWNGLDQTYGHKSRKRHAKSMSIFREAANYQHIVSLIELYGVSAHLMSRIDR